MATVMANNDFALMKFIAIAIITPTINVRFWITSAVNKRGIP